MAENLTRNLARNPAENPELKNVYVGRADVDAAGDRGWLLGHFKPLGDVRHSEDVEIKWGVHPRGDERAQWVTGEHRTALLILISGRFRVELPGRSVVLAEQGDYIVWGHGVDHSWHAEEESVVLTVRWPSVAGYAVPAPGDGSAVPGRGAENGSAEDGRPAFS
ncbi:signal peptidase I [Planotetraspora kaengkrachanensis]|uniref:signal peptidase I n=1 Tax=Planotetraspora kaengkrachanensis TaxID=575193 RepID=UPI001EF32970|nr:signal peptidase I [Planotetraspora kaengkrachanensis]